MFELPSRHGHVFKLSRQTWPAPPRNYLQPGYRDIEILKRLARGLVQRRRKLRNQAHDFTVSMDCANNNARSVA